MIKVKKTKRILEAEDAVDHFISLHRYTPTYEDIANVLSISTGAAYARLRFARNKMSQRKSKSK